MHRILLILTLVASSGLAWGQVVDDSDTFLQGPEARGHTRDLAGTVIGVHTDLDRNCYILRADRPGKEWEGLGGGGRFFLCQPKTSTLAMGEHWTGKGIQEGTRLHRMGPRRRVLPLFTPSGR